MAAHCAAANYFVTRIKDDSSYRVIRERALTDTEDQHILKDKEIMLDSPYAVKAGMGGITLRRVAVYDADKGRTIELITNNPEWSAATVGCSTRNAGT